MAIHNECDSHRGLNSARNRHVIILIQMKTLEEIILSSTVQGGGIHDNKHKKASHGVLGWEKCARNKILIYLHVLILMRCDQITISPLI